MAKITIFGLAGTGKGTVSKSLAQKLGYNYVAIGDMMRQNAKELGISLAELKQRRLKDPSWDHKLDEFQTEYGKTHDNFIFESRLPWYFIPDSFKIKLDCKFDERIKRITNRDGSSFDEQKEITLNREKTDQELYQKLYDIENIADDEHFDLIVDTTGKTIQQIVAEILKALPHK